MKTIISIPGFALLATITTIAGCEVYQDSLNDEAVMPSPTDEASSPSLTQGSENEPSYKGETGEDTYTSQGYTKFDPTLVDDRVTYRAYKYNRGTTISIPESTIVNLCSDIDGCTLRMGMYNWNDTGRVASRHSLFFYNSVNRAWRAESNDAQGSDYNGATEHIFVAWSCYFTDGQYTSWSNNGDGAIGFGLLSWNQYNAECWLTIID